MTNWKKFSQFTDIDTSATNLLVGLSGGANSKSPFPLTWTTGTRPVTPTNGMLGFNTTIQLYEYWDNSAHIWQQLGTGDAGTVTEVDSGTGLTGGPITTSGTLSFAAIAANSFWANTTGASAVPTVTSLAAFLLSANNLFDLTNKATARTNLGVQIGTNVEAWSAILDEIATGIWPGATSITTLGTITTGIWHGSTIGVDHGGTGNTTFTAYSVICAGTTATGAFQNVSGLGAAGQVLTSNGAGGLPSWQNTTGSGTVNSGLQNQLAYYAANGTTVSGLATGNNGVLITSSGGVPSISSTLPSAVQLNITSLGVVTVGTWEATPVALAFGGTNAALVANNGGIFYSTATAGAILSGTATANQVLMSGSSSAPAWSTATYPPTTTINQLLYSSAANIVTGLATANSAVLITSAGGVPSLSQTLPSAVQGNITTLGTITAGVWNGTTIDVAHGGTGNTTFTAFSVICAGTTATGAFQNVSGLGSSGQVLTSNGAGTLPTWQNATGTGTVNSGSQNQLAYYAANGNTVSGLSTANNGVLVTSNTGAPSILAGSGTTGTILQANAAAAPSWSSITYPSIAGSAGKILRSDGSNNVYSTATFSDTYTASNLLYSNGANTVTGLATANSSILVTNSSGVPSLSTTIPSHTTDSITFSPTTHGLVGTTTNDNAAAGYVGQYLSSVIPTGSAISLTTGTPTSITSITLTAGDWDIRAGLYLKPAAGTTTTNISVAISLTNNAFPGTFSDTETVNTIAMGTTVAGQALYLNAPLARQSVSGSTTVYIIGYASFAVSTMTAYGYISARRMR